MDVKRKKNTNYYLQLKIYSAGPDSFSDRSRWTKFFTSAEAVTVVSPASEQIVNEQDKEQRSNNTTLLDPMPYRRPVSSVGRAPVC